MINNVYISNDTIKVERGTGIEEYLRSHGYKFIPNKSIGQFTDACASWELKIEGVGLSSLGKMVFSLERLKSIGCNVQEAKDMVQFYIYKLGMEVFDENLPNNLAQHKDLMTHLRRI
jgi:hypothetical protein